MKLTLDDTTKVFFPKTLSQWQNGKKRGEELEKAAKLGEDTSPVKDSLRADKFSLQVIPK